MDDQEWESSRRYEVVEREMRTTKLRTLTLNPNPNKDLTLEDHETKRIYMIDKECLSEAHKTEKRAEKNR